jgi:hypothetical protein
MKVTVRVVNLLTKVSSLGQIAAFLLLLSVPWLTAAQGSGFDVPLKKTVVDFGRSRYYPSGKVRNNVSCYLYPTLMVKEYDEGQREQSGNRLCRSRKKLVRHVLSLAPRGKMSFNTLSGAGISMVPRGIWCSSMLPTGQMEDCHSSSTILRPRRRFLRIRLIIQACGTSRLRSRRSTNREF